MKIIKIEEEASNYNVYNVTFQPNWLEKIFGVKEKTKQFKDNNNSYTFGGGHVYLNKKCEELGNGNWIGEAIDKWRRRW
jgi:hypothetical protein